MSRNVSRWVPCKCDDFLRRLRRLGFAGHAGGRHQFLVHGSHRLAVPSHAEYSVPQLKMMLREVAAVLGREISQQEWNELK